MQIFRKTLGRGAYAGRLFLSLLVAVLAFFVLDWIGKHVASLGWFVENILFPAVLLAMLVYWIVCAVRRLANAGVSVWAMLLVFFLGPLGFGLISALPSAKKSA